MTISETMTISGWYNTANFTDSDNMCNNANFCNSDNFCNYWLEALGVITTTLKDSWIAGLKMSELESGKAGLLLSNTLFLSPPPETWKTRG